MRPSSFLELAKLPKGDLALVAAEGLELLADAATSLWTEAERLWDRSGSIGHHLLDMHAVEESAKFLILLDLIRCPGNEERREHHARKFGDHLAKGIYAEACDWRPVDFAEVRRAVEGERPEYYRDGPNDDDWVFYNRILNRREDVMYVDYVRFDSASEWVSPKHSARLLGGLRPFMPASIKLVRSLRALGITNPERLRRIGEMWEEVSITDQTTAQQLWHHNLAMLKILSADAPAHERNTEILADAMPFPMYDLDLNRIRVKRDEARSWTATR